MAKRKIVNPYIQVHAKGEYKCFGCSPLNSIGLQLEFYDIGDMIETTWKPQVHFEGFFNILHGGIQATLHDEIAGWTVFTKCATSGVTKKMNIAYHRPVYVDKRVRLTAKLLKLTGKSAKIHTCLFDHNEELCSEGTVEYYVFPLAVAKRKHFYPGVEAFYE